MSESEVHAKPAILVVDDEELLRLNAADLLEDNGYAVIEAANAEDALRTLERRPDVRLLFTDIQMPALSTEWSWRGWFTNVGRISCS